MCSFCWLGLYLNTIVIDGRVCFDINESLDELSHHFHMYVTAKVGYTIHACNTEMLAHCLTTCLHCLDQPILFYWFTNTVWNCGQSAVFCLHYMCFVNKYLFSNLKLSRCKKVACLPDVNSIWVKILKNNIRDNFDLGLPHLSVISNRYNVIDGKPGFTCKEMLTAFKKIVAEK